MDLSHFLAHLERSGLLAPIDLAACRRWARQEPALAVEALSAHLLRHGKLSLYQRRKLLDGRSSGFLLGQHEILAPLGKGGMSYVYLARDHEHSRLVALKIVTPRLKVAHPSLLARLEREMKFGRRFAHPGIARAFALSEHNGVSCLALEYVPGMDLFRRVRRQGPLSAAEAARLMGQVALALDEIHRCGVVHTDLKPGNIIFDANAAGPRLIDFGLAIDLAEPPAEAPAAKGRIAGTFGYAAPEQTKPGLPVGPAADLFAVGSTLFFLLTGEVPFTGQTTKEKIRRIRHEEPAWYLLPAGTPAPLRRLMQELLEKKPKRRPRTAAIVADGLLALGK